MNLYQRVLLLCEKYQIKRWKLNSNGKVDIDGNIELYEYYFKKLPLPFGEIYGSFYCAHNRLTTLDNFPIYIDGCLVCSNNDFKDRQNINVLNVGRKIYSDNLWKF